MNLISEILRGIWMIEPSYGHHYFPMVHQILTMDHKNLDIDSPDSKNLSSGQCLFMSDNKVTAATPGQIDQGALDATSKHAFILSLVGPITKYNQFCGPAGMIQKAKWLKEADQMDEVCCHVLNIDSGGGETRAAEYLVNQIAELKKPVFAYVSGMAASAAYWIASATEYICASSKIDHIGSIGVYISFADYSQWYAQNGIRLIDVYAKKSTEKNRDYLDALKGDTSKLQELVDQVNEHFLSYIREKRSQHLLDDSWTDGRIMFAPQALDIGLIDGIGGLAEFVCSCIETLK